MTPQLILITPKDAEFLLGFNDKNRKPSERTVRYFISLLEQGEFIPTHQGIAFTGTALHPERLIDGQHRLAAIKRSGIPAKVWVFWETDQKTYEATDCGRPRSFTDRHGWPKDKTAICGTFQRIAHPGSCSPLTKSIAEQVWKIIGDDYELLIAATNTQRRGLTAAPVKLGACIAMIENPTKKEEITEQYRHLVLGGIKQMNSIIGRLFVRLLDIKGSGGSASAIQFCLSYKAFSSADQNSEKLVSPHDPVNFAAQTISKHAAKIK